MPIAQEFRADANEYIRELGRIGGRGGRLDEEVTPGIVGIHDERIREVVKQLGDAIREQKLELELDPGSLKARSELNQLARFADTKIINIDSLEVYDSTANLEALEAALQNVLED